MKKKLLVVATAALILSLGACKKELSSETETPAGEKVAPDGFAYVTTKKVEVNVRLLSRDDKPIDGALVSIYNPASIGAGKELSKVISDANGYVKTTLTVPASLENLIIDPAYIGLAANVKTYIKDNSVIAIIGGQYGYGGNVIIETSKSTTTASSGISTFSVKGVNDIPSSAYNYDLSKYDELGRPKAILPVDKIDFSALMEQINSVLPERQKVQEKYIKTEIPTDLRITALADVWITFVHEGADYRNSLAYYTYPTGHAPTKAEDITNVNMVFPNASFKVGTGAGNMIQGDKVLLGRFTEGTSIGFVVLQNAYQNNGSVNYSATKFFSTEGLNPESDPKIKRHNVVLHNLSQRTFLIGFEDIERTDGYGSDQDFNDLIVYAQSNPVESINPADIPVLEGDAKDTDKDGVPDAIDKYPNDPERAYDRYYPSETIWGTTTFEDNWPAEGDYDLNDLVLSYRYKFAMSATNKVVDLTADYKPLAAGATFQNGFGVELPLTPAQVKAVTGLNLSAGTYIKQVGNGLESNQSKAVIIPFDNYRNLFGVGTSLINTYAGSSYNESKTITVGVTFSTPLADDFTALAPFNPFLISNLERGREVHLVNHAPTDLANKKLFNSTADDSDAASGRYYTTRENRPFAIDFYGPFSYPLETVPIFDAYTHFSEWAKSNGKSFPDWYFNTSGYINTKLIYTKK
ncbi:LruC domain-containing protein [Pedobacter sp. MC2016-14]|uniref:LruC domain-containing protein n=1 Tax=Pedobacter sp. MC2016-14 TaxID=2897327 RepID=UPI001E43A0C0|nr:LruC domain-containing protein [Pedobacter sp. MC2016-14]MCD0490208.1 LruC domain-containing protein [Pedobacter sp. MC2016-14]